MRLGQRVTSSVSSACANMRIARDGVEGQVLMLSTEEASRHAGLARGCSDRHLPGLVANPTHGGPPNASRTRWLGGTQCLGGRLVPLRATMLARPSTGGSAGAAEMHPRARGNRTRLRLAAIPAGSTEADDQTARPRENITAGQKRTPGFRGRAARIGLTTLRPRKHLPWPAYGNAARRNACGQWVCRPRMAFRPRDIQTTQPWITRDKERRYKKMMNPPNRASRRIIWLGPLSSARRFVRRQKETGAPTKVRTYRIKGRLADSPLGAADRQVAIGLVEEYEL